MKRRMIRAITFSIITFIALLVFIGLYIDETRRVQETYRKQYIINLQHVSEDIDAYLNGEGDYEMRYRRITSDMSSVNSFAFMLDDFTEQQKTVNELYTCLIKYPDQMSEKLEELKAAVDDMAAELDDGYKKGDELVDSIDKKGH